MNFTTAQAEYEKASELARREPSLANREAVKSAWIACEAVAPKRKVSNFASRAGKRQYAERMANEGRRS